MIAVSVFLHAGLAGALTYFAPATAQRPRRAIELSDRKLPPPKVEIDQPDKPKQPDKPDEPKQPETKKPKITRRPKQPAMSEKPPAEEAEPDQPQQREPTDKPPTGPKIFGIPDMESTATAPPGQGVQVPEGDSLKVSPKIRKRGPPSKGFKKSYKAGERAPVSVVTTKPKPLEKIQPEYPQRLQDLGIEGRVVLELTVDGKGKVVKARVLRGLHPELDRAAIAAARRMRFVPAKVNGTPVKLTIPYSFVFVLD